MLDNLVKSLQFSLKYGAQIANSRFLELVQNIWGETLLFSQNMTHKTLICKFLNVMHIIQEETLLFTPNNSHNSASKQLISPFDHPSHPIPSNQITTTNIYPQKVINNS